MRAYLPSYELKAPRDLSEALEWMACEPRAWKPFAGGTDLMVLLEAGKLSHRKFISIWNLRELQGIQATTECVTIGALTTYTEVRRSEILSKEFPLLSRAAAETGGIATQNRGTLGGNIANASPAADSPPALLIYDAELELVSAQGVRFVPYRDFHKAYKKMDMGGEELIRRIRLPRATTAWKQYYRKVGTRQAQSISKVCFAGAARVENGRITEARIALGSVAPTMIRAYKTEDLLCGEKVTLSILGRAQDMLGREIAPIDDMRSSAKYRGRVAQNLLAEFLEAMAG